MPQGSSHSSLGVVSAALIELVFKYLFQDNSHNLTEPVNVIIFCPVHYLGVAGTKSSQLKLLSPGGASFVRFDPEGPAVEGSIPLKNC